MKYSKQLLSVLLLSIVLMAMPSYVSAVQHTDSLGNNTITIDLPEAGQTNQPSIQIQVVDSRNVIEKSLTGWQWLINRQSLAQDYAIHVIDPNQEIARSWQLQSISTANITLEVADLLTQHLGDYTLEVVNLETEERITHDFSWGPIQTPTTNSVPAPIARSTVYNPGEGECQPDENGELSKYCVGSSTSAQATGFSFQRKTFFESTRNRHWISYYDGQQIQFRFSTTGGDSWTGIEPVDINTSDFSLWYQPHQDEDFVWLVVNDDATIRLLQGRILRTTIEWTEVDEEIFVNQSLDDQHTHPVVSLDSAGYLWGGSRYFDGVNYAYQVTRSTDPVEQVEEIEFSSVDSLITSVESPLVFGSLVPLDNQSMYAVFSAGDQLLGCQWGQATNQWHNRHGDRCGEAAIGGPTRSQIQPQIDTQASPSAEASQSAQPTHITEASESATPDFDQPTKSTISADVIGDLPTDHRGSFSVASDTVNYAVQVAFITKLTQQVVYARYDQVQQEWSQVELSQGLAQSYPSLSIDSDTGDTYVFYIDPNLDTMSYRWCQLGESANTCASIDDWSVETPWQFGESVFVSTSYSAPSDVFAIWGDESETVSLGWGRLRFGSNQRSYTQDKFYWFVPENTVALTDVWPAGEWGSIFENQVLSQLPATNQPLTKGDQIRIQMNIEVGLTTLPGETQAFTLQYSESEDCTIADNWTDVGAKNSEGIWRLYDHTALTDTDTQVNQLSTSDVAGGYSEINPSAANPNAVTPGQRMEWDWPVENNGAKSNTSYCFRMVKDNTVPLDSYKPDSFPKLVTAPSTADIMRHGNTFQNETEQGFIWAN